jgi:hypothetical protein
MDVQAVPDERGRCGRRSRVVLIPRRWDQALRDVAQGDGGYQARHTEESTKQLLKPIAQGMPDCFGEPVVTNACAFYQCTRGCGCAKHPAFPAPSEFGRHERCRTRATHAAGIFLLVIASWSLSSAALCADPLARNDGGAVGWAERPTHAVVQQATADACPPWVSR